jgi:methanogenic corrinoid protein MtbC1/DNA-binding XRE family transcriptional regulator
MNVENVEEGETMQVNTQTRILRKRYIEALLSGEQGLASQVIEEGLSQEVAPTRIYLDVLAPSIIHIGDLWHKGEINVAQEHLATQISMRQMGYLMRLLRPSKKLGVRVVVTAVENEHHAVGARMLADFLYMDGWDVDYLGDNTPTKDLVEFVQLRGARLVGLSVTLVENLPQAREAVYMLHQLETRPVVMVGGAAVEADPMQAESLGADARNADPLAAIQDARSLLGLGVAKHTLDEYLKVLGDRIQTTRKGLRWSQQRLADEAGLDRTYISMVEGGKQNLTLGAVMKIADALEVTVDSLLGQEASFISS